MTVHNTGDETSRPTKMRLQSAPLGAFVPWEDLTSVIVPAIEPQGSVEISTDVATPRSEPLGDFGNVPPQQLLTAVAGDDEQESDTAPAAPTARLSRAQAMALARGQRRAAVLSNDPFQLLGGTDTHWVGNINVLIGDQAVERHTARALRIYPGLTNVAIFFVGQDKDEYQFQLEGSGTEWDARLLDYTDCRALADPERSSSEIQLSQWVKFDGQRVMMLAISPPLECEFGSVDVHVRQRSSGRKAVVEFSLDEQAAGTGCYTI